MQFSIAFTGEYPKVNYGKLIWISANPLLNESARVGLPTTSDMSATKGGMLQTRREKVYMCFLGNCLTPPLS